MGSIKCLKTTILATFSCRFIYSFIYFHSSIFIYLCIIFGGGATVTLKCEKLQLDSVITQETSLDTNKLWTSPKFWFRFYCLKIIGDKNTLRFPIVLICYERDFYQEVPLKFEDEVWGHFPFLQIRFRIGFWYAHVYTYWSTMLIRVSNNTWSGASLLQCSTFYHNLTILQRPKVEIS